MGHYKAYNLYKGGRNSSVFTNLIPYVLDQWLAMLFSKGPCDYLKGNSTLMEKKRKK